jgi:transposase
MIITGLKLMFHFTFSRVAKVDFSHDSVVLEVAFDRRRKPRCPYCGSIAAIEQIVRRSARDLPFLSMGKPTLVSYEAVKCRCSKCGKRPWVVPEEIDAPRGATHRLIHLAVRLSRNLAVSTVSALLGLSESAVRRWDKAFLKKHLPEPNLDDLNVILIDEKSIGKRHKYITVVLNGETGELLHCEEGKKKESLTKFFESLSEPQKQGVKVACIDRAGAYLASLQESLPDTEIAFDKFHLVQNFNSVIDAIRRDEWRRVREENDEEGLALIKGQRFNLLRRTENNTERQQSRLDELLAGNHALFTSHVLLDDFREVLSAPYVSVAKRDLNAWLEMALNCGVERVEKFAKGIAKRTHEVLNAVRYKVTNGRIEGFNNLISRVLHRGCGYCDVEYLKLKLRQASLPIDLLHPLPQE